MGRLDYHEFTRRKRPHVQRLDARLFVTFRLAGSIPQSEVRFYKAKREWFKDQLRRVERIAADDPTLGHAKWLADLEKLDRDWFKKSEEILHRAAFGPSWMRDPKVADKVAENLHRLDGDLYRLDAFSIMSNHAHIVFNPLVDEGVLEQILRSRDEITDEIPGLSKIMHRLKGRSARECNLLLGRSGSFWERESFDRVIREGRFDATVRYVLNNPVKIHLVDRWDDYQWNYCRKELIQRFR